MEKNTWLEINRPDTWRDIIEASHAALFDTKYLFKMGDIYRREFDGEFFSPDITIPKIPLDHCLFPQASEICPVQSGFDLPLLITPKKNWNRKIVAFASQDPLRRGADWPNGMSMCTPWGFSAQKITSRGGKKIWLAVETLCRQGYGAYFTDVWKLYVEPSTGIKRNKETKRLEKEAFKAEANALKPHLWVSLGAPSFHALNGVIDEPIDRHPHPTAWGHLKKHYGTADEKDVTIQKAIIDQINRKLG